MNSSESIELLSEAYDHLWHGRFRMALAAAQKVYEDRPEDYNAALCLAWALLENGEPARALELSNLAVELSGNALNPRLYRGFFLSRMSIFEGALSDINSAVKQQQTLLVWSYVNKARSLAGLGRYFEALEEIENAIILDGGKDVSLTNAKKWYKTALEPNCDKHPAVFLDQAEEALHQKENWFTLFAARKILDNPKKAEFHKRAILLELEAMYAMFQFKPAFDKSQKVKNLFANDQKFTNIFNLIMKQSNIKPEEPNEEPNEEPQSEEINPLIDSDFYKFPNAFADFLDIKLFDPADDNESDRKNITQFSLRKTKFISAEIIFQNPSYKFSDTTLSGNALWYLNNELAGRTNFKIKTDRNWEYVSFIQSLGDREPGFWNKGRARIEIIINNQKVCERWFNIADQEIILSLEKKDSIEKQEMPKNKPNLPVNPQAAPEEQSAQNKPDEPEEILSLEELLDNLNGFIGLNNIKQSMKDFVSYLQFLNERKQLGFKSESSISLHCVFEGNPGTGKTTVARLLGKIFKAMGLLPKGHVIEVDRSGLVGQYVGETAIKTDKVISDALGGVLFIDEAYTLVKKSGGGQDFGQEAIDTLLKKMEDKGGEFAVIVAGYPEEMKTFIESNPGMKSRFNQHFDFEDYSPDELLEIFKRVVSKEDYKIQDDALDLVLKEFTRLYRNRDKSFGNARIAIKLFNDVKIKLSKRYLQLNKTERTEEAMQTIVLQDVEQLLNDSSEKSFSVPIDEENLNSALKKLNALTGIEKVKKEVDEIVKLARYFAGQKIDLKDKFSDHLIFLGNPGTGKTTVARIFGEIYSALGILPKGHLIETDRQGLVASFVGQTAKQTNELVDKSLGGTLFIDEAYTLIKKGDSGSDFGQEAIDTLLKRMEDDRGKFIVIGAGYTEEMKSFIASNPGLQSRFTKTFVFEDYNPDELIKITKFKLAAKDYNLKDDTLEPLRRYFFELYRNRDKNFGNARLVRNFVDSAIKNHLLNIVSNPAPNKEDEYIISSDDIDSIISVQKEKKSIKIEGDPELLTKYMTELHELTGLDSVKKSVDKLINSLKVAKLREERGLTVIEKNLHSVFMGNPGTGKTTVARLLSKIYKEMGLLEKGHLVEVDRAELVAGYQGQTAIKTENVIQRALGGTLFIDEAYTLSRGSNDFGQEVIDTLLKKMEDYRDKFVVIVAGYPDEMNMFLDSNPGLQSRFSNHFMFEDYNPRQMLEISAVIAQKNGYHLDEGALQYLLEIYTNLYRKRTKNFGNARSARNILYECISSQEERISKLFNCSDDDLMTINFEDVEKIAPNY